MAFQLTYTGIPFCLDTDEVIDFVSRFIPTDIPLSVLPPSPFPGKNVFGLAIPPWNELLIPTIGQFYYPTGATRWSQFRALATTTQKAAMEAAALANGSVPQPLVIQCDDIDNPAQNYTITTNLYMLPARPLAVHGNQYDGLWLVELVDERFYWQQTALYPLHPTGSTSWATLITSIANTLGVTINYSAITSVYLTPEPDSQLWANYENPALLLDAIAWNLGRIPVRNFDGTYNLQRFSEGDTQAQANRGPAANVRRLAGGDLFQEGTTAPYPASQALFPASVTVTFPKYITGVGQSGSAAIPHFRNSRFTGGQSRWIEDSYGDVYAKTITLAAAGYGAYKGSPGSQMLHTTAKATYNGESDSNPANQTTCDALALQLAQDLYSYLAPPAYDEVYPGTVAWVPECGHDLLWTYRRDQASLRVTRQPWNYYPSEFQHSTGVPSGVGGKSVALTVHDGSNFANGVNVLKFVGVVVSAGVSSAGLSEAIATVTGWSGGGTVPSGFTLEVDNGGTFLIDAGATTTFNNAPTYNGVVTFGSSSQALFGGLVVLNGAPQTTAGAIWIFTGCLLQYYCGGTTYTVVRTADKNVANGVAGLDGAAKVAPGQIGLAVKGDIPVADGAGNVQKVAVGTNNQVLTANTGATNGLQYATLVASKGDLLTTDGTNLNQLAVSGTNGQVLTVSSGATNGIAWATPSGGTNYQTVAVAGTSETQRPTLNFISGGGITVAGADNSGASRTDVTISAAGGGGTSTSPAKLTSGGPTTSTASPVTIATITNSNGLSGGTCCIQNTGASFSLDVNVSFTDAFGSTSTLSTLTLGSSSVPFNYDFHQICANMVSFGYFGPPTTITITVQDHTGGSHTNYKWACNLY